MRLPKAGPLLGVAVLLAVVACTKATPTTVGPSETGRHSLGPTAAPVTVVDMADFQ